MTQLPLFSIIGCCSLGIHHYIYEISPHCVHIQSLVDMAPKYILEQFLQQELLINITEHEVTTSWLTQRIGIPLTLYFKLTFSLVGLYPMLVLWIGSFFCVLWFFLFVFQLVPEHIVMSKEEVTELLTR